MNKHLKALGGAALLVTVSVIAVQAQMVAPTVPPDPPKFAAQGTPNFVSAKDIYVYKALPEYHEPDWVTSQFVTPGKLPPVKDRLPKEPLVFLTANMTDGNGDLRRRHASRDRWSSAGVELPGGPDPRLGRHRHRHVRVPHPDRAIVRNQGGRARAAPQPRQELGMVGRWPRVDHAPDRRRQMVGWRSVQRR